MRPPRFLDRFSRLRRVFVDPPHRVAERFVRTGLRAGFQGIFANRPLSVLATVAREGVGVRSVHALHAAGDPNRLAVIDRHRTLTYKQMDDEIRSVAAALHHRLGARGGQPVLLLMENRAEYLVAWFALFRLGVAAVHASRHATVEELADLVERSGAKVMVVSDGTLETARTMAGARPELEVRIVHAGEGPTPEGVLAFEELRADDAPDLPRVKNGEVRSDSVVYTSGTTGRPKGAVRDFNSFGLIELLRILEHLPLCSGDRHLVVAPLYHSSGQAFVLINTALGNTIHLEDRFDAERTLTALSRWNINTVFMVPTMIRRILELPRSVHEACPTPDLRVLIAGAAPFPQALRERAIERFGAPVIFDFYGATELGWVTIIDGVAMLERPGSVGRPIAGQELLILNDAGDELLAREVGKVYVRSAQTMAGYLRDEQATQEISHAGCLTVEDLGWVDEDGYLYLAGRARDMVISGGVNVYPIEIESVIAQHPSVRDVAVVGVADDEWGERLVGVVAPGEGFDSEAIEAWARERLAPYKVPKRWETLDELPRNPTGKVLKQELRARFGDHLGSQST